jgi:hypothetical protein
MPALPTLNGYNSRTNGSTITIGTSYDNTTLRLDDKRVLHAILKDLRFYNPEDYVQADIPEHQNELIHWDVNQRASGAVFQIDEFGKQVGSVNNSLGVAQSAGQDPTGITLNMTYREGRPKRYGSVMFYTSIAKSVSKRDIVAWGEAEMGIIVAEQHDKLVQGIYDAAAQDLYPASNITTDNDADWTTGHVFTFGVCVRVAAYLDMQGFRPPHNRDEYPVICSLDAMTSLLLENTTATILRETAERGNPMAGVFAKGYIGSLRGLAFFKSNRMTTVGLGPTAVIPGYRMYICTDEALGVVSMTSQEYGVMADNSTNSKSQDANRDWEESEMPRPVQVIRHDPGAGTLGQDLYKDKGAIAEKHTIGFEILNPGRLVRVTVAAGAGSDYGVGRAGTTGSF